MMAGGDVDFPTTCGRAVVGKYIEELDESRIDVKRIYLFSVRSEIFGIWKTFVATILKNNYIDDVYD